MNVKKKNMLRPREKRFVSQACAHKYVDSFLLHSPTRQAQFFAFFKMLSCQKKKSNVLNNKNL